MIIAKISEDENGHPTVVTSGEAYTEEGQRIETAGFFEELMERDAIRKKYPSIDDALAGIVQAAEGISEAPAAEVKEREQLIVALAEIITGRLHPNLDDFF